MELLSLKHLEPRFLNTSLNCKFSKPPYPVLPRICRHHGTFKSETSRAQVLEYLNCVKLLGNHSAYQLSQTRNCCRSSPQPCSASSQSRDNRHGYDDHRVAVVIYMYVWRNILSNGKLVTNCRAMPLLILASFEIQCASEFPFGESKISP